MHQRYCQESEETNGRKYVQIIYLIDTFPEYMKLLQLNNKRQPNLKLGKVF